MKNRWYLQLIKGIVLIILAFMIFSRPAGALLAWTLYIGIAMLLSGAVAIVLGISAKGILENWGWRVFEGVIDVFLGVILISNPILTAAVLPFLLGFWGSFYGVLLFIDAFSYKESKGIKMISGILVFLLSTTIMFNPLFAGLTLAIWFGVVLLIAGISNVIFSFKLKSIS